MSDITVASRYAKSLFDLSLEKGVLEEVHNDMREFRDLVDNTRDLQIMLKSPVISHLKKWSILKTIFAERFHYFTMSLIEIACRKNREAVLHSVSKEFHRMYIQYKGIQKAFVTTAFPLTEELRLKVIETIKQISDKKEVELEEIVDANIIGGFVLRVDDRQLDESLSGKLKQLRQEFKKNPYVKEF
jgi:F-type H+-transporting ATPase subunit delta